MRQSINNLVPGEVIEIFGRFGIPKLTTIRTKAIVGIVGNGYAITCQGRQLTAGDLPGIFRTGEVLREGKYFVGPEAKLKHARLSQRLEAAHPNSPIAESG